MQDLDEVQRMRVLMVMWRCWHVRNELVHNKPAPPVEASWRFLLGYMESLIGTKQFLTGDFAKSKMVITDDGGPAPLSHDA